MKSGIRLNRYFAVFLCFVISLSSFSLPVMASPERVIGINIEKSIKKSSGANVEKAIDDLVGKDPEPDLADAGDVKDLGADTAYAGDVKDLGADTAYAGDVKGFETDIARSNEKLLGAGIANADAEDFGTDIKKIEEKSEDTLTIGVPADRCPVFYQDADTGELVGIGIDLMRAAAEAADYDVRFAIIEEENLKDALDNGGYDVLLPFGSAIKSTSGVSTVISDKLNDTPFTIVTEARQQMPPLNELRVGMLSSLSGVAETVSRLFPGIEIVFYETMPESVNALRTDKVDALLNNSYVWSYVLQKPSYTDLVVQPSAMVSVDFCAGTQDTPAGRAIIERLNVGIATLTDAQRQAIVLDHTSRRLYKYDLSDYLYMYGLVICLTVMLFTSLVIITLQRHRSLRLEQEEEMQRLIDHDSLTGLLSLSGFRKKAEELIRNHPDIPYFISYNNINNFKYINDSFGREAGDDLLRFWAGRSQEFLSDIEAIARIEGDHFAVLRTMGGDERMLEDEKNVLDPVREFFMNRDKEKRVQICSGIYVLTQKDYRHIDVDHMLDCARVAEKRIREVRKDGYEFYNPNQWEKGKRMADIVSHLPIAIKTGEIQVWYQPQIDYDTGKITGTEALCRWNHGKLGWLRPSEFIPAIEESGQIYDVDSFVWEKVCQDLRRWNEEGFRRTVSVNLSRRDLVEGRNIPGQFFDLVNKYGISVDQLHIEITETAYVENPDLLIRTTVKLREFGFQVEMDDFGSGYSSLHMLKEVPVDRIKLDLHFLTGAGDPERGRIIVSHMIQLLDSLGMKMIAEGVENVNQARFLQSRGCSEMQGFYFYKPMSVQEFEEVCKEQGQ